MHSLYLMPHHPRRTLHSINPCPSDATPVQENVFAISNNSRETRDCHSSNHYCCNAACWAEVKRVEQTRAKPAFTPVLEKATSGAVCKSRFRYTGVYRSVSSLWQCKAPRLHLSTRSAAVRTSTDFKPPVGFPVRPINWWNGAHHKESCTHKTCCSLYLVAQTKTALSSS